MLFRNSFYFFKWMFSGQWLYQDNPEFLNYLMFFMIILLAVVVSAKLFYEGKWFMMILFILGWLLILFLVSLDTDCGGE